MIRRLIEMPFTVLIGVLAGFLASIVVPDIAGAVFSTYDRHRPVLEMHGQLVSVEDDSVLIHIKGAKIRGEECRLVTVYGYSVDAVGRRHDATATRMDRTQESRPRPEGEYDIGVWRVRPVYGTTTGVQVWTHHDCFGRPVLSKIADVAIPSGG
jgi:hypothetical protein